MNPAGGSWLNRIEVRFTVLRCFTPGGTGHAEHETAMPTTGVYVPSPAGRTLPAAPGAPGGSHSGRVITPLGPAWGRGGIAGSGVGTAGAVPSGQEVFCNSQAFGVKEELTKTTQPPL
ncbi:hypothetical protein FHS36_005186 [Streptomyces eurocidicus]|uniref:Uncharacterized protein n=1 Tax=Streptomyces eurocidicus TaxID=66423 RepID=A0A7W8BE49_STREU|nr:hypothetical protein [Streptomyces eurocidicus]